MAYRIAVITAIMSLFPILPKSAPDIIPPMNAENNVTQVNKRLIKYNTMIFAVAISHTETGIAIKFFRVALSLSM